MENEYYLEPDLIRLKSTPTKELRHDIYRCITVNHFIVVPDCQ